jgi:hypothetical protein
MTPIERKLHRAAVENRKERVSGIHNEVCLGCGVDLAQGKEDDHMIGRKHGDLVWPLCGPCHQDAANSSGRSLRQPRGPATCSRSLVGGSCRSQNILS